ncbi:MAG: hypothetical protein QM780_10190 [Hyphomicrobium sp.]
MSTSGCLRPRSPTKASRTQVDRTIAVVDALNTASPATYFFVHVDT